MTTLEKIIELEKTSPNITVFKLKRMDTELTDALNAAYPSYVKTFGGYGYIMECLGDEKGAQVLDTLEQLAKTNIAIKWAFKLIDRGVLDFGSKTVHKRLQDFVTSGLLTAEDVEALIAPAKQGNTFLLNDVSDALNSEAKE